MKPPYFAAGCNCADDYLPNFDKNGLLTCFQEFLRGPCEEGDQYINVQEEDGVEPKCMPTNCDNKNQIRYKRDHKVKSLLI